MSGGGGYHAVVLAAGAGSRFGGSKLTARYGKGVLLDAALRTACAAPVESVIVVTGAHQQPVATVVAAFASGSKLPIRAVLCEDHAAGMSASLRRGLASVPDDAAGAIIFLGDMPRISRAVPPELLAAVLAGSLAAVPSFKTRWGHPVLISRPLFEAFSRGGGDGGGRDMLSRLGGDLAIVEIDHDGILTDADTRAELDALWRIESGTGPQAVVRRPSGKRDALAADRPSQAAGDPTA